MEVLYQKQSLVKTAKETIQLNLSLERLSPQSSTIRLASTCKKETGQLKNTSSQ